MIRDGSPSRGPYWSSHVGEMLQPASVNRTHQEQQQHSQLLSHHQYDHHDVSLDDRSFRSPSFLQPPPPPVASSLFTQQAALDDEVCDVEYIFGRPGHGTLFAVNAHLEELPTNPDFLPRSATIPSSSFASSSTAVIGGYDLTPVTLRIAGSHVTVSAPTASFALFSGDYVNDGLFCDEDTAAKKLTGFPSAFTFSSASAPNNARRRVTLTATPDQKSQEMLWSLKRRFELQRTKVLRHRVELEEEKEASRAAAALNYSGEQEGGASSLDDPLLAKLKRESPPRRPEEGSAEEPLTSWNVFSRTQKKHHQQQRQQQPQGSGKSAALVAGSRSEPQVLNLSKFNSSTKAESERRKRHLNLAFAALDSVIQRSSLQEDAVLRGGEGGVLSGTGGGSDSSQPRHGSEASEEDAASSAATADAHRRGGGHRSVSHVHDIYGHGDPIAAALARRSARIVRAAPTDYHPLTTVPLPSASAIADSSRSASGKAGARRLQHQVIGPAHPLSQLLEGDGIAPSHPMRSGPLPLDHLAPPSLLQRSGTNVAAIEMQRQQQLEEHVARSEKQFAAMRIEMEKMREQLVAAAAGGGGHHLSSVPRGTEARHIAEAAIRKKNDGTISLDFDAILTPPATRAGFSGVDLSSERKAGVLASIPSTAASAAGGFAAPGLSGRRKSFTAAEMASVNRERGGKGSPDDSAGITPSLSRAHGGPSFSISISPSGQKEAAFSSAGTGAAPSSANVSPATTTTRVALPTAVPDPHKPIANAAAPATTSTTTTTPAAAGTNFAASANPMAAAAAAAAAEREKKRLLAAEEAKKTEDAKKAAAAAAEAKRAEDAKNKAAAEAKLAEEAAKKAAEAKKAEEARLKAAEDAKKADEAAAAAAIAAAAARQPDPAPAVVAIESAPPGRPVATASWVRPTEPTPAQQAAVAKGWPMPPAGIAPPPKPAQPPPPPGSK